MAVPSLSYLWHVGSLVASYKLSVTACRLLITACICAKLLQLYPTLCKTVDCSADSCKTPLSKGFSRQEYWSGSPCPPPGDLPDPRIEPTSLMFPALVGGFFTTSPSWEDLSCGMWYLVPRPGIQCSPLALGAWNLSQWTTREVPLNVFF